MEWIQCGMVIQGNGLISKQQSYNLIICFRLIMSNPYKNLNIRDIEVSLQQVTQGVYKYLCVQVSKFEKFLRDFYYDMVNYFNAEIQEKSAKLWVENSCLKLQVTSFSNKKDYQPTQGINYQLIQYLWKALSTFIVQNLQNNEDAPNRQIMLLFYDEMERINSQLQSKRQKTMIQIYQ